MPGTINEDSGELQLLAFSREKGLTSRKFYDELEQNFKFTDYDVYCGTAIHPKHSIPLRHVCATILNYLKYNGVSDNDNDEFSICKLLNYWAYNKLNDLYHSKKKSEIDNAYKVLENIWKERVFDSTNADYYKKCKPDIVLFDHDDWKQRKELYEYYIDSGPIIQTAERYEQDCDNYYNYVKNKERLYKYFEKHCPTDDAINCPSFYNKCKMYNPKDVLPRFICFDQMKKKELTQQPASQAHRAHPGSGVFSPPLSNTENPNPSTSTGAKAGNVFLGVVVTSMASGALYKFTPLGNMLRNGFGRNNNMRNFNGVDNGIYGYAPESFYPYSGGAQEHYIGYHPA
ncbi:VIR protein [Plasmodium vivax]|uniref:VIR protein n=1 Tax=Plasmodium vivax TaxID=5855 RepID=A0A1G4EEB6_PLAVI|nr:Plasmodium vivax Vir protein, putative [Plasmodium vivax]SCA81834.1 VIR protein [Plasmodium vivax]